jgi:hypothetical protein
VTDPRLDPETLQEVNFALRYDNDKGEVHLIDQHITQVIEIRTKMVDDFVRLAVIAELERLGYTVHSPEAPEEPVL